MTLVKPPQNQVWDNKKLYTFEEVKAILFRELHNSFAFEEHIYQLWNKEYIQGLSKTIKKLVNNKLVLEVCAGNGALTHWLKEYEINIIATDNKTWERKGCVTPVFPIIEMEAIEAIKNFNPEMVIMSWVPYGSPLDYNILQTKVKYVVNIGEGYGGCTGSEEFWDFKNEKHEEIVPSEKFDCFNLCRTDYSYNKHITYHSSTTILKRNKNVKRK